ncbi:MAG: hypothetical protein QM520_02455, partial [Gammaproteobacteria bacterium]|nr:hypothetical protein [Gammaproteobacteria bacterium]
SQPANQLDARAPHPLTDPPITGSRSNDESGQRNGEKPKAFLKKPHHLGRPPRKTDFKTGKAWNNIRPRKRTF